MRVSSPTTERRRGQRLGILANRALLTLMLGHFTLDMYVGVLPVLYPLLIQRFSLDLGTVGFVSLAYSGMGVHFAAVLWLAGRPLWHALHWSRAGLDRVNLFNHRICLLLSHARHPGRICRPGLGHVSPTGRDERAAGDG